MFYCVYITITTFTSCRFSLAFLSVIIPNIGTVTFSIIDKPPPPTGGVHVATLTRLKIAASSFLTESDTRTAGGFARRRVY